MVSFKVTVSPSFEPLSREGGQIHANLTTVAWISSSFEQYWEEQIWASFTQSHKSTVRCCPHLASILRQAGDSFEATAGHIDDLIFAGATVHFHIDHSSKSKQNAINVTSNEANYHKDKSKSVMAISATDIGQRWISFAEWLQSAQ